MILKLLWWAFERLIGRLPPDQAEEFRNELRQLLLEVVRAGASGAVQGLRRAA